jgi:hypothetical protein
MSWTSPRLASIESLISFLFYHFLPLLIIVLGWESFGKGSKGYHKNFLASSDQPMSCPWTWGMWHSLDCHCFHFYFWPVSKLTFSHFILSTELLGDALHALLCAQDLAQSNTIEALVSAWTVSVSSLIVKFWSVRTLMPDLGNCIEKTVREH